MSKTRSDKGTKRDFTDNLKDGAINRYRSPSIESRSASMLVRHLFSLCEKERVTISELADRLSMSRIGVYYWKSGRCTPDIFMLETAYAVIGYKIPLPMEKR